MPLDTKVGLGPGDIVLDGFRNLQTEVKRLYGWVSKGIILL